MNNFCPSSTAFYYFLILDGVAELSLYSSRSETNKSLGHEVVPSILLLGLWSVDCLWTEERNLKKFIMVASPKMPKKKQKTNKQSKVTSVHKYSKVETRNIKGEISLKNVS